MAMFSLPLPIFPVISFLMSPWLFPSILCTGCTLRLNFRPLRQQIKFRDCVLNAELCRLYMIGLIVEFKNTKAEVILK